jgi:hypothetical protein
MVRGSDQEQAPLSCAKRVPRCATTCRSWWSADGYGCCFPASHAPYRSPMTTGARVPRTKRVAVARAATCPRPAAAPVTTEARAPRLPRAVRAATCPRPAEMTRAAMPPRAVAIPTIRRSPATRPLSRAARDLRQRSTSRREETSVAAALAAARPGRPFRPSRRSPRSRPCCSRVPGAAAEPDDGSAASVRSRVTHGGRPRRRLLLERNTRKQQSRRLTRLTCLPFWGRGSHPE